MSNQEIPTNSTISSNKKIFKNTIFLYIRMLLTMGVSFFTIRIVLNTLGVVDYGVYNVVGGIVTFFSFMSASMASASQRFFSFEIGRNDIERLKKTFTVNWIIYGLIALLVLILLETAGLWFVNNKLNVPAERFDAARWVYHFSVLYFLATTLVTPFMAMIIAHEDMQIYAYVSIVEVLLKLGIVFLLIYLPWDKLIIYSILMLIVSIVNAIVYVVICSRKYVECQFSRFYWEKSIFKEVTRFTGWTLFGQFTTVTRRQAVTILINQMFNPAVVAAMAIASNITTYISIFSNNFNTGLYPPIIKNYAAGQNQQMLNLMFKGSKVTFFLMWVFAAPLIIEMNGILTLWLKNPPQYSVLFTRLALIEVLINSVSLPLMTMARAAGKMKIYELTLGTIQLLIFFVGWLVLSLGAPAYSVLVVAILVNCIMFVVRLFLVKKLIDFSITQYLKLVIIPVLAVTVVSSTVSVLIHRFLPQGFGYLNISIILSGAVSCICMYFVGIGGIERRRVNGVVVNKVSNFFKVQLQI